MRDEYIIIIDDSEERSAQRKTSKKARQKSTRAGADAPLMAVDEPDDPGFVHADPEAIVAKSQEYTRPRDIIMRGATGLDGVPWIQAIVPEEDGAYLRKAGQHSGRFAWIRLADWSDDAGEAKKRLRTANILLFDEAWKKAIDRARQVTEFPPLPVIERPGWTGGHFALPSGEVFSPTGSEPAVVLFEPNSRRCSQKGDATWFQVVEQLARGQAIITFVLSMVFAAPLLVLSNVYYNPGFELVGPKRKGKSTLQQLAASIMGPALAQDGRGYIVPANATTNAIEEIAPDFADLLMIIEEMGLYYAGEKPASRALKMQELVMRMSNGTVKARKGEPPQAPVRDIYLTSSNEPLVGLFELIPSATSSAATDRLRTIPITRNAKFGIFDKRPKGFANSNTATQTIAELVKDHHGLPIRIFLRALVEDRAKDEGALKVRIQALSDEFREAIGGVDENEGSEASIADVYGLIYAAAKLAQEWGALPAKLKVLHAAAKVYRLSRSLTASLPTNVEVLQRLAKRKGVIQVDPANLREISDQDLNQAPALLRTNKGGARELLLTDAAFSRAFGGRKTMLKDPEVKAIQRTDSDGRAKVSVTVRTNKKQERLYAFVLPADKTRD